MVKDTGRCRDDNFGILRELGSIVSYFSPGSATVGLALKPLLY